MIFRTLLNRRTALIIGIGLSITACDSAYIVAPPPAQLEIAPALSENLLQDGDFESGMSTWQSCNPAGTTTLTADASEGNQAINIRNGACLYQNIATQPGINYRLSCQTKQTGGAWSSVTFAFLDQNSDPLVAVEKAIDSDSYSTLSTILTAPAFATEAEVLFYTDGSAVIDSCRLEEVATTLPPIALVNGDFTNGLNGWQQCEGPGTTEVINSRVAVSNGSCISQITDVREAVVISPDNQPMTLTLQCSQLTKTGTGYAGFVVAYLDENYEPVAKKELSIDATTTNAVIELDAPLSAYFAEITLYSEADTSVGACSISN